jgi:hypothetical protein
MARFLLCFTCVDQRSILLNHAASWKLDVPNNLASAVYMLNEQNTLSKSTDSGCLLQIVSQRKRFASHGRYIPCVESGDSFQCRNADFVIDAAHFVRQYVEAIGTEMRRY